MSGSFARDECAKSGSMRGGLMAEKSTRRVALEQSLAEDPADTFLRYGLALQCLRKRGTSKKGVNACVP